MSESNHKHPQRTREQIITHCKQWLTAYKSSEDPLQLTDRMVAIIETDILTYPIETQDWINEDSEPELWLLLWLPMK